MTPRILDDIGETPAVVERALARNDRALTEARTLLAASELVRVIGIGSSRHAAGYAATALEALAGVRAAVADAPGAGIPVPPWQRGDVALVLSQSGRTPALLDVVRAAGVPVIAVVNDATSALATLADVALDCSAGVERVVAATKSVSAQLALVRALAGAADIPTLVATLSRALDVDVGQAAARGMPDAVVAGGFAGGWLADEVAIKLAEVAGRVAASEPLVEHLHGPVAAKAAVLAIVDGDDPNLPGLAADVVRIGIDDHATVVAPSTGDASLDFLAKLVVAQRLVVALAQQAGEDPDAARGLAKVTDTR